ncbi:hypothetical protein [Polaribacter porphyrae]|uniref:DUF4468 domain-containing protein n=1 Tax=Polaribacter porphyrae TaxID=1137780 RepID=A0A2S7WMU9_9FLAO|nr:hypothetical protein [Polaribacter porphyrae]PQJ78934.1 hypothetical protein BTO18_06960 [Polaribacter porphyrae]
MKQLFLTVAISLFFLSCGNAQTPKTPETPKKQTSYSITFDTDDKESNSSVSIKRNDNIYKFTAKFHESKTGNLKKMLVDKLEKSNLTVSGGTYRWIKKENGEKLYDCKLTDNTLRIYVDKEYANNQIITMIDELGILLKDAISGTDSKEQAKKDAERELKRAERALAKAKKELERAKRRVSN